MSFSKGFGAAVGFGCGCLVLIVGIPVVLVVLGVIGAAGKSATSSVSSSEPPPTRVSKPPAEPATDSTLRPARPAKSEGQTMLLAESDALAIYYHYQKNEVKADNDLKDRWGIVRGKVGKIGKDMVNSPYVMFFDESNPPFKGPFGVQCIFSNAREIQKLADLSEGQIISVVGICKGKFGNVLFRKCQLVPDDAKRVGEKVEVTLYTD